MLRGEATNTNFIIFGLTRSENEPTFYSTGDEHANHNTTDAVNFDSKVTGNSGFLQYLLFAILTFIFAILTYFAILT